MTEIRIVAAVIETRTVDELVADEWSAGVSAGAAARQVCRSLNLGTPLRMLLEELLADANRSSFERSNIIRQVSKVYPEFGRQIELDSFRRINGMEKNSG